MTFVASPFRPRRRHPEFPTGLRFVMQTRYKWDAFANIGLLSMATSRCDEQYSLYVRSNSGRWYEMQGANDTLPDGADPEET